MVKTLNHSEIRRKIMLLFGLGVIAIALMLFLPAWSTNYWHAWVFMAILFIPCIFIIRYLLKHDPDLLVRRMQYKEKVFKQQIIIKIAGLFFCIGFLLPGFDFRFGWSNIPLPIVIAADVLIFLGYMLVFLVFKENTYTSRIVEVVKGQKVISTGPYAIIRHPMYTGVLTMYIFMPIGLGSYFALPFFLPIIGLIVLRILNEEEILRKDLKGYISYTKKVKYRLIPGIW